MHPVQQAILELSRTRNVEGMKLRELGKLVGEEHPQKIKHHRDQLRRRGLLGSNAGIRQLEELNRGALKNHSMLSIPILGSANCGEALLDATESFEGFLNISRNIITTRSKGLFAIRAVGDSMDKADFRGKTMENGDFVIVDSGNREPANDDYVLSIINGAANIKKFVMDKPNQQVVLVSESSRNIAPIYIHLKDKPEYFVNGMVVAVIKKPKTAQAGKKG